MSESFGKQLVEYCSAKDEINEIKNRIITLLGRSDKHEFINYQDEVSSHEHTCNNT
jgi:hypothetical protein